MGEHADDLLDAMIEEAFFDHATDDVDHPHTKRRKRRNNHPVHADNQVYFTVDTDNSEDTNMAKELDIVTLFQMQQSGVRLMSVQFPGTGKLYVYKVPPSMRELQDGDYVLVPTGADDIKTTAIERAIFRRYTDLSGMTAGITYKWAICVLPTTEYTMLVDNDRAVRAQMALNDAIAKAKAAVADADALNWMPAKYRTGIMNEPDDAGMLETLLGDKSATEDGYDV